jgi:hypothetical protein
MAYSRLSAGLRRLGHASQYCEIFSLDLYPRLPAGNQKT